MIVPSRASLLVIDMQRAFLDEGSLIEIPDARLLVPRLKRLISLCKEMGVLVVYTRISHELMNRGMYPKLWPKHFKKDGSAYLSRESDSFQLYEGFKPDMKDVILDKDRYSAFQGTNLEMILKSRGINTVIITGLASNVCCESTARDAFQKDYTVYFVSDGSATLNREMHEATLRNIELCFGYVVTSKQIEDFLRRGRANRPKPNPP